jgi:large repetitive protein
MQGDIHHSFADQITWIASCSSGKARKLLSSGVRYSARHLYGPMAREQAKRASVGTGYAVLLMFVAACTALTGCGAGGYAGNGITSLSTSAITIDAGQSFQITAALTGDAPVSWTMAGGSCSAAACGSLSSPTGATVTYTAPAGITTQMKVALTATTSGTTNSSVASITVNPDPVISGTPPPGMVGTAYSTTLSSTGGTAPLTWSTVGSLPAGLTFNSATGVISGMPTTAGSIGFSAQVLDSSDVPYTAKAPETIAISMPIAHLEIISGNPPAGTVGIAYSTSLSASGGTTPYSFSVTSGSLPAGLTLTAATGVIEGTPTAAGTSVFTGQVEDASGAKASASFSITINAGGNGQQLTLSPLPGAIVGVPYNATIGVTGGTAPYSCLQTGGGLPAGLTLSASCVVSGTPTTAGTSPFTVKATDSSSPALTVTGPESITVAAAGSLTLTSPPNATVGTPYSGAIGVAAGTAPYSCVIVSGTLPAGLTLGSGCLITGTPTTAGTSNLTVTAIDSSSPIKTITGPVSLTVVPSGLTLALATLPGATVGVVYSATIGVSGGTAPYTCQQTGGSLPTGLTLSASCVVSGTPTTAGTSTLQVKATDSSSSAETVTGPESITVAPAGSLTITSPPSATVGTPYSGTIGVSGGIAPYSCVITAGTLPAGLTLGAGCVITGTPTTAGTSTVTVKATDTSTPIKTTTGPVTLTVNPSALTLTLATLPGATVGVPYSATIGVSGGTAPYGCSQVGGALPAGLALSAGCVVSGTPTTAGTSTVQVKATDSSSSAETVTGPESITVAAAGSLTITSPPSATVGTPYSGTIGVSGGIAPYSCVITAGTLPAGLTLGAGCVITGTPTTAGTTSVTVKATDTSSPIKTTTSPVVLTVTPSALVLTLATLPGATVGVPYSATIGVSGGTAPYACSQAGGALPPGLTLYGSCVVSGTPTTAGTSTAQVKATDSSSPVETVTGPESITVSPAPLTLTLATLPGATVGVHYSATIGVSGGTSPYACSQAGGALPAGLSLSASCVVSGTPTTAGTTTAQVKATDSGTPVETVTGPESITVSPAPLTLTLATLPGATVGTPYSATIGVSGGTAPYACSQAGGTLPAGLTLSAGCVVSGTPTAAGTSTVQVKATDTSSPVETVTGPESITVSPAPLTLTLATLPGATVGVPYSAIVGVSGGTAPYACSQAGGTLPAGLILSAGCVVSGTPTTAGTSIVQVKATDSSTPVETVTGPESITVSPGPLTLTLSSLPNATVGTPYTATIGVAGGTPPYSCSIVAGTLPAGLTLGAACVVSGTPTVAGTVTLSVKATDSTSPVETTTGPVGLTVLAAPPTLTLTSPPNATVNVPYSGTIGVTGGKAPYTCTLTAGTLPAGLTLSASCVVSGTPTTAGTATITVKATDSSTPAATTTGPVTVTVLPATATLTLSSPPNATVSVPYTGTIGVAGGTAPYSCTLVSGTLPAGLSLGAACVVSGTPTVAGTSTVTIHATDSATPTPDSVTGPVSITVSPIPTLSLTGSLPNATLGVAYTQTLVATGGLKPYTYSLTAGSLPPGLSLSPTGTISGTPTAVGASSFTVTVTDTETTPQKASLPLVLLVVYPATATDSELIGPYAFLFQGYDDVLAGVLAYQTATVASFTADGTGVISDGELDSNHQSSTPSGNTISSQQFLGTYTLATNNRGYMTITTLNANGTTGGTATYAITVKAPVAPATVATQADMIEFDDNGLEGTRGSGTMLAQQPTAFSAGLKGSYAFGFSGDTPCLPTCTVGIIAGPVASVGQFTTDGTSLLTSGTSDANIATKNYADALLTGSYAAADGNGRLQLTMDTAGTPTGIYPTDYAVYLVNANQAFVMSTDKHSTYLLLAGTAQLQTQATFSNASLNGAFIGYENAQSDPGLLGVTLGDVLNLSTATIFRTTGNAAGTCDFTNVDVAGLTGLVNELTGLGSNATILNALLGTYQSTGTSACTVTANGRGVLNYPTPDTLLANLLALLGLSTAPPAPREFYLISPNSGYFLETGYAGLGRFEPQAGTPSTNASLDGTYVYASLPAGSLASINTSGIFVANGAGNATTTTDANIGVGTINVLQTDVTTTSTYHVTSAADGRLVFDTTIVLYEIEPGRFVLVDTNALTTSPSISLLY